MDVPHSDRPFMPGYGLEGPEQGTGLLPWQWAREKLVASHDDPAVNATVRVRPRRAFGLVQDDFSGSPTRWRFGGRSDGSTARG